MLGKRSIFWLLIISVGLIVFSGLLWWMDDRSDRSFDPYLVRIDAESVTRVELYPELITDSAGFELLKRGDVWVLKTETEEKKADTQLVREMLTALNNIRLMRVVSRNPEKWSFYCVTDSVGSRVKAYAGNRLLADFHMGAMVVVDPSGAGSETHPYLDYDLINYYVRRSDRNEVYMASGFFGYHFTRSSDNWYDRTLIKADPYYWDVIESAGVDSLNFTLVRQGVKWMREGKELDEAEMSAYLDFLSGLRGKSSLGGYPHVAPLFIQEMRMISNRTEDTIRLRVVAYGNQNFYYESTQNPGTVFAVDNDSIFRKVFIAPHRN